MGGPPRRILEGGKSGRGRVGVQNRYWHLLMACCRQTSPTSLRSQAPLSVVSALTCHLSNPLLVVWVPVSSTPPPCRRYRTQVISSRNNSDPANTFLSGRLQAVLVGVQPQVLQANPHAPHPHGSPLSDRSVC